MQWEVVIGLEVHTQLSTQSKIFSGSSTAFGAAPNTQASAVDLALPGVLPVLNRGAVERALRFGLAVGATINSPSVFARKNYFYPDLPKGYQISQYELPIVAGGHIAIQVGEQEKLIRLTRAHLEEDAGKSLHEQFQHDTGIDLNRAGTPLLEIVSEPDMRSAAEAVAYAKALHSLVTWIGICDGNMQEGSFRVDANVSVRPLGQVAFGTRREIKNLNSFKFLEQAIQYEVQWQIEQIEEGHPIVQATVLFDPASGATRMMRTKEDAHDYRYFPDPDLPPLHISAEWLAEVQRSLPELPAAKLQRFRADADSAAGHGYALGVADARQLVASHELAHYFEAVVAALAPDSQTRRADYAKLTANWLLGEVMARLNREDQTLQASPVDSTRLAGLLACVLDNTISTKTAKDVLKRMWECSDSARAIIDREGLRQETDLGAIEAMIDAVLASQPDMVAEYKAGKDKAFNALVGQCMKASKGKANPAQVNELLRRKLAQ
jgi:aspartyl-tRNA(Asn)/glutamyl-tRNA(Gln) amidotransferase subunit B